MTGIQDLKALSQIVNNAVAALEKTVSNAGVDLPSLDTPIAGEDDSATAAALSSSAAIEAVDLLVAATAQIAALVRSPYATVMEASSMSIMPAVLQFLVDVNVPEILRGASLGGMSAENIAKAAQVDVQKLAHSLRFTATHHIFKEVSPNHFAHNRISSTLDTGAAVDSLKPENTLEKHLGSNGVAAMVKLQAQEVAVIALKLTEHYTSPDSRFSRSPTNTVAARALGVLGEPGMNATLFGWLQRPENAQKAHLYGLAMASAKYMSAASDAVLEGFDWASLKQGSVVVDVGGGVGNIMLPLYARYEGLKFVVQDRAQTIPMGEKLWNEKFADALPSGRVTLAAHSFLEPQPVKDAAVFFLRNIMHNWPDAEATAILKHLRDAAVPATRLVLNDRIIPYATPSTGNASGQAVEKVPGVTLRAAPAPLLTNFGRASANVYGLDIGAQMAFNGLERTFEEFEEVTAAAGWKIERVNRVGGDICNVFVIAVPM
ncbi:S-adenosyl-L-methionine-dependent methyltransferase [Auriculariales sp. MPI-PUGE-AT-0066]|nr:S-adenosyl-L-methionine-dependent methyltransferase [Auriculariales sp. MPI-PUGE-AT-0066]